MKQVSFLFVLTAIIIMITAPLVEAVSEAGVLFLRIAPGSRPGGMGEAFVSIADDATATYWNPAGLGTSPMSGTLESWSIPSQYGEISAVASIKRSSGEMENWFIAGGRLVRFDGKTWTSGKDYLTSSDQTLTDFLKTVINTEDEAVLKRMADQVIEANSPVTAAQLDDFMNKVRASVPERYLDKEELEKGLAALKTGYDGCLLSGALFAGLRGKLADGLKDSVLTNDELDRITFSLSQAVSRFLPSHLTVPYSTAITADLTALGATGRYLWVGTTDGLYRLAGSAWARYSKDNGLPSDTILTLANADEYLYIGTAAGIASYYQGNFTRFENLPPEPVTAITCKWPASAYAVIGSRLYQYENKIWSDSRPYKIRIDDTIESLIERSGVYRTPSEYQYLLQRIKVLNEANVPGIVKQGVPTDPTAAPQVVDSAGQPTPMTPATGEYPWLVEGNLIQLPLSPFLKYQVTALAVDVYGTLWVGTTSGLLSYDNRDWRSHGYDAFTVPRGDSAAPAAPMTAVDIASKYLPQADPDKVNALATVIDEYNELNGQAAPPGRTVSVYNWNTGSAIHSIGTIHGDLFVGTDYGLERKTDAGWEAVGVERLDRRQVVATYDYEGHAYYVADNGLTTETKGRPEFVVMFVKWLPSLSDDMYYGFFSFVRNFRGLGTFGLSGIYLTYGQIEFRDQYGNDAGTGNPYEFALGLSYGTALNSNLRLGITGKFIHSRLFDQGVAKEKGQGIASDFAVDAGLLYRFTKRMQLGVAMTNFGPDISYIDAAQSDHLPMNLAVGLSYKVWDTPYNRVTVQGEMNRILVGMPHTVDSILQSTIFHIGAEYSYMNFLAVRMGYKHDESGEVKHLTFGAGLEYSALRFDLAYIPSSVDSPLANILRISFSVMF
jgi:hypothetical protein